MGVQEPKEDGGGEVVRQVPGDADRPDDDTYGLMMLFAGVVAPGPMTYHYRMEHLNAAGAPIDTLKDMEFSSTDAGDFFREPIRFFTK